MVPSLIVPVAALPRTPNGKVDRKSLSLMTEENVAHVSEPPRDLLEQWLANIWAFRLGKKEIPRDAHFFDDLGGHSLAAFEVFTQIESRMGVTMGLAILFQAPTVELLAGAIRQLDWKEPRHITLVAPGSSEKVVYLFGQQLARFREDLSSSGSRVMAINGGSKASDLSELVREIAGFEAARPILLLATDDAASKEIRNIVSGLSHAGFADISLSS
jgi:acyl carrier protein